MTTFTIPGLSNKQGNEIAEILQKSLSAYNDLHLTLKHVHWNVVGPNFIGVHEMIDPQVELVRGYADDVAERIAALGKSPQGTPGAIIKDRTWDDYSVGRDTVQAHLAALDLVYTGVIEDLRKGIDRLDDLDLVSQDLFIGQAGELEKFQWFVRAHLENSGGQLANEGAKTEKAAASRAEEEGAGQVGRSRRGVLERVVPHRTVREFFVRAEQVRVGDTRDGGADQRCEPEHPELHRRASPLKNATPVDRAGLTDVFEMGIEMRWISVSVSPIDKPAKPFGARSSVDPRMTNMKMPVRTTSVMITAHIE